MDDDTFPFRTNRDDSLRHSVYRKRKSSDRYLNAHPHHQHIKTLL